MLTMDNPSRNQMMRLPIISTDSSPFGSVLRAMKK